MFVQALSHWETGNLIQTFAGQKSYTRKVGEYAVRLRMAKTGEYAFRRFPPFTKGIE